MGIAGGGGHSLFLKSNGSLWGMGDNSDGQLGDGTSTQRLVPIQIISNGVAAVAAGYNHSLFIKTNGSLWGMGYNVYGQLGDGTTATRLSPVPIVSNGVVAIAAGNSIYAFALE